MSSERPQINSSYFTLERLREHSNWLIILLHGGYFAIGYFADGKCKIHKASHKYVLRKPKKQAKKKLQSKPYASSP